MLFALNRVSPIPFLGPSLLHFHLPLKCLTNYMVLVVLFPFCLDHELPASRNGFLCIYNPSFVVPGNLLSMVRGTCYLLVIN